MNDTNKPEAAKDAAKTLTIQIATGGEDERSLEKLLEDVKAALGDSVKRITVFGAYYLINGEAVRPENVPEPEGAKPSKKTTKKKPEPEPDEFESFDEELETCSECGEDLTHDEGSYDDLCGNCADRSENEREAERAAAGQPGEANEEVRKLAKKVAPGRMSMRKRG